MDQETLDNQQKRTAHKPQPHNEIPSQKKTGSVKKGACLILAFTLVLGLFPLAQPLPVYSADTSTSAGLSSPLQAQQGTSPLAALAKTSGETPGTPSAPSPSPVTSHSDTYVSPSLAANETQASEPAGRLVVKLRPGASPETIAQSVQAELARKGPLQYITLALEPSRIQDAIAALKARPDVLSVSPSQTMKIAASGTPSALMDPYAAKQWGLTQADVPQAWDLGATGNGITIAVVDTGVDVNHPDLRDNLVSGYNAITGQSGLSAAQDNNGHGTHVAGIIAAAHNTTGIVGVAYQAKIMPIKAMSRTGEGSDDIVADGIVWAADHGANIINLSIGSDTQEKILDEAIQYAFDKGCLVVAAAGNKDTNTNYTTITYPAADPQVLAVTATDQQDHLASFSLTGPNAGLAAPGVDIFSDFWQDGSCYATDTGTSMASPFVAGVAALVWSKHPDFSAQKVRQTLEDSALDLGDKGRDNSFGYGRVDAYWAVKFAAEPATVSSPAAVDWSGGIVQGGTEQTSASLTVPARAFGADPTLRPNISLSTAGGAAPLPEGVHPIGDPLSVTWNVQTSVQKLLPLAVTPNAGLTPETTRLRYLYRWTGTRWLLVGGGVKSGTVTAGISEPGIYQVGSAALPQENRLAGTDRIATALQISQTGFPNGADTVLLAQAEDFPDALTGAPLAYKLHAPILLTPATELPATVLTEIKRLQPKQIILLGGTGAISGTIEKELKSQYSVTRLGGLDRYGTAQAVAAALGLTGEAVVVNGDNFPDALAMSAIAAENGVPILLTQADTVPTATDQELRRLAVTATVAVGGKGVISADTLVSLPNALRLAGQDRYETAAQILQAFPAQGGMTFLATGENFPDALTGGVLAAFQQTDLILVPPTGLTKQEAAALQGWSSKKVLALGGSGVVSEVLLAHVQTLLQ